MIRLSLRDLWSRKLRTVLTMLAIVLGVAMIAGTYVITDQINNGFHNIFEKAAVGTDVNITHKAAFQGQNLFASGGSLSVSLLGQVKAVSGVADAAERIAEALVKIVPGSGLDMFDTRFTAHCRARERSASSLKGKIVNKVQKLVMRTARSLRMASASR